jgi:hypothetical protein
MIKIPELDIEVDDIDEFNEAASDALQDFCIVLAAKEGTCRAADPEQDSFLDETCFTHIWMNGASELIRYEQWWLYAIGEKYFGKPNLDLDIETSWFREP